MNSSIFAAGKVQAALALCALCALVLAPLTVVQGQAAPQGTITVNKEIVGTTTVSADDFSFLINGGTETQFEADGSNEVMLDAGIYTITEPAAAGFVTTYSGCEDINLTASGTATCTITNTASTTPDPGYLVVNKVIVGTTSATADDFSFDIVEGITPVETDEPFEADGSNVYELEAGSYSVTEDDPGSGFIVTYANSLNGDENCDALSITPNATTTCTITNTATTSPTETGTLVVEKVINGGTEATSSFSFLLNGGATTTFETDGVNVFTDLATGTYTVTEVPFANYTPTYSNCMNVDVLANATTTCTITNTFNVGGGQLYEITGLVWDDEDEDGIFDGNEDPLSGWTVRGEQTGEITRTDVTDSNGRYTLLVTNGDWEVSQVTQSGWDQTHPAGGTYTVSATGTAITTIVLGDYNFGNDRDTTSGGGGGGGGNGIRIELTDDDDDDDDNGGAGGRTDDDDDDDDTTPGGPGGIVLGEQTSVYPYGAPDTGFGGMSEELSKMDGAAALPLLSMIGVMLIGFAVARTMRDPYYDEEEMV